MGEIGKAVSGTVEALKNQPFILALILVNLLFLGGGLYVAKDFLNRLEAANQRKDTLIADMAKRCFEDQQRDRSDRDH